MTRSGRFMTSLASTRTVSIRRPPRLRLAVDMDQAGGGRIRRIRGDVRGRRSHSTLAGLIFRTFKPAVDGRSRRAAVLAEISGIFSVGCLVAGGRLGVAGRRRGPVLSARGGG